MKNPITLDGVEIHSGTAVTRAAAATAMTNAPIGSLYVGQAIVGTTKPNLYVKVTATTTERIVSQASD